MKSLLVLACLLIVACLLGCPAMPLSREEGNKLIDDATYVLEKAQDRYDAAVEVAATRPADPVLQADVKAAENGVAVAKKGVEVAKSLVAVGGADSDSEALRETGKQVSKYLPPPWDVLSTLGFMSAAGVLEWLRRKEKANGKKVVDAVQDAVDLKKVTVTPGTASAVDATLPASPLGDLLSDILAKAAGDPLVGSK